MGVMILLKKIHMRFYLFSLRWTRQMSPNVPDLHELQNQIEIKQQSDAQIVFGIKFVHQIVSLTHTNIFTSNSHPFIIEDIVTHFILESFFFFQNNFFAMTLFLSWQNLSSCLWLLFNSVPSQLYLELQFFCAVANYGQVGLTHTPGTVGVLIWIISQSYWCNVFAFCFFSFFFFSRQGLLSFALFGLDKHLIILPFKKR